MFGVQVKVADDVDGALSVSVTVTVLVIPPPVTVSVALLVPTVAVALFTLVVMAPAFAPDVGVIVSHVAFLLTVHVPLELTVTDWFAGLAAPCVAVNERLVGVTVNEDRLVGLAPIAGLTETTGTEVGESNCVNPGISAANLLIVRPPVYPLPEADDLPTPAAASGMVPVGAMPPAMDPVAVADDGATLMVVRGTAVPTLLLSDVGSLD